MYLMNDLRLQTWWLRPPSVTLQQCAPGVAIAISTALMVTGPALGLLPAAFDGMTLCTPAQHSTGEVGDVAEPRLL